jgi:predicted ATP-binding protein involved in virulence
MNGKRKAYVEKFDAQLKEWSAEIAQFKAKADKAQAEAKIEYYKTIRVLQYMRDQAEIKLDKLKTASDDAWEDLMVGTEKAWAEIKTSFQDAASRFK